MGNSGLSSAKTAKKDEFYTQLTDVEKEMKYYTNHFKNKHIFCNCDDPEFSNFWRYFALNFKRLGLKQLTSTHYEEGVRTYRMDMYKNIPEDAHEKETFLTLEEIGVELPIGYITPLEGDGDFRSPESIEILKESDIVVTNPPFSLFREYIAQLMEFQKNFIILGNINVITYKEVFPLLKDNKMWLGGSIHSGDREFQVPDSYPLKAAGYRVDEFGRKYIRVKGVRWFTNLDYPERHEDLVLYKKFNETDYPKYDNYDAIEVGITAEIPVDYDGVMGVPITFIDKYNPDQFSILGISKTWATDFEVTVSKKYTNALQHNQDGKVQNGNKVNDGAVVTSVEKPEKGVYYTAAESVHFLQQKYARIFIKKK